MKVLISIIVFLTFTCSLTAQKFTDTSYHSNGKIKRYGLFDKERKVWVQKHFYYNGSISEIRQYDSSDFTYSETLTAFNINGTPAFKYQAKHGKPTGIYEEYYSTGALKQKGEFFNGFKTGKWYEYFPDGKLGNICLFKLSHADSSFNAAITFENIHSLSIQYLHVEWGEADPSLGENLQFINISKFEFPYLLSSSEPKCTRRAKSKSGP